MERFRQTSPETETVRTQTSSDNRKVPVVYYLCRNRQIDHPHFMEVSLSSSNGLYLKDVVERLNVLRGKHVASMYSWSCKRSYKNRYVWHDLSEDDLILPAHGDEYVLKGSELFQESDSGQLIPAGAIVSPNQKALPNLSTAKSQEGSSSSSRSNGKATKSSRRNDLSPPNSNTGKNSGIVPTENKLYQNATSTQTDPGVVKVEESGHVLTQSIPTDNSALETSIQVKRSPEICRDLDSGPDKTDTLESLIRAELRKLNKLEISSCNKVKASNLIMQLISNCGSFPSCLFSTQFMLGENPNPNPNLNRRQACTTTREGVQSSSYKVDRLLSEKMGCLRTVTFDDEASRKPSLPRILEVEEES